MKYTFEVDDQKDGREAAKILMHAQEMHILITELDEFLRTEIKHGDKKCRSKYYQEIRDKITEIDNFDVMWLIK